MSLALKQLPDDPDKLKALLIKERSASIQREDKLKQKIDMLFEALRLEKHRLYGTRSEKSLDQSDLFFDEAETFVDSDDAVADEHDVTDRITPSKKRKPSVRKPLPPELPRIRQVIELSIEERLCSCGCMLVEIGEDISEQVDIIPARVQVIQHARKKYACKACEETIKTAPRADVLLPKSIASGNTMAYIITSKYADGLPLYRLSGILGRYGIDMPRQTLSESVLRVAEKVTPLIDYIQQILMKSPCLHMDETRLQVLNEPNKTAESNSYMWVQRGWLSGKPLIQFHYDPGRSTASAERLLQGFAGTLMTDGYKPYRQVAKANGITHLCCWAHARRKFIEAQKAQPKGKTGKADMAISFIAKLYAAERQTKASDAAARHQTKSLCLGTFYMKCRTYIFRSYRPFYYYNRSLKVQKSHLPAPVATKPYRETP